MQTKSNSSGVMSKQDEETKRKITRHDERLIQKGLTRFFYGKILDALSEAENELVVEEHYEAAAKVRDQIQALGEEFKREIDLI